MQEKVPQNPSEKLTPEEVIKLVEEFKRKHTGVVQEFSLLQEEQEQREFSQETVLAYKLKRFLDEIRPELEDRRLIENAIEALKNDINSGREKDKSWKAPDAFVGYILLKQSIVWHLLHSEDQDWIEGNIKDPQLIENATKELKKYIVSGQEKGKREEARDAILFFILLKNSNIWPLLKSEDREWIENNIKNQQLIENMIELLKKWISSMEGGQDTIFAYVILRNSNFWSLIKEEDRKLIEEKANHRQFIEMAIELFLEDLKEAKEPETNYMALNTIVGYTILSQFQQILEEEGRRKDTLMEYQRAREPGKYVENQLPPQLGF